MLFFTCNQFFPIKTKNLPQPAAVFCSQKFNFCVYALPILFRINTVPTFLGSACFFSNKLASQLSRILKILHVHVVYTLLVAKICCHDCLNFNSLLNNIRKFTMGNKIKTLIYFCARFKLLLKIRFVVLVHVVLIKFFVMLGRANAEKVNKLIGLPGVLKAGLMFAPEFQSKEEEEFVEEEEEFVEEEEEFVEEEEEFVEEEEEDFEEEEEDFEEEEEDFEEEEEDFEDEKTKRKKLKRIFIFNCIV